MQTKRPPIFDVLSRLMQQTSALNDVLPIAYQRKMQSAPTARAFYDVALELGYAANSKELRDTGDELVHHWCHQIWLQEKELRSYLTVALFPHSSRQRQQWLDRAFAAGEQYAFRDDGALHICLLHATLQGARLRVRRLWTHVCNFLGESTDFAIDLNDVQRRDVENGLAQAAQMQVWIEVERSDLAKS